MPSDPWDPAADSKEALPVPDDRSWGEVVVSDRSEAAIPHSDSIAGWFTPSPAEPVVAPSSAVADPLDRLLVQLLAEMTDAARQGRIPLAEEFLARYPDLSENTDAAFRLIDQEVRLRRQAGLEITAAALVARFPRWKDRVGALAEPTNRVPRAGSDPTNRISRAAAVANLGAVGDVLGDYRLRATLGRGACGVVYLAEQLSLAGRPVVLKLTPRDGREHLSLARLQHANIVPLYAVQDVDDRDFRMLCMPYLGGTTLARLLSAVRETPLGQRTGRDLLSALDEAQTESPIAVPTQGPARQLLARVSYMKAVCWLGACLADALHFAHQRDLLHLDIKPTNVLVAADGTPMLLDFHLAQAPLRAGQRVTHRLGGTAAYMPAEQWAAMAQARDGKPVSTAVDGRADIYALGVLLYEALGGAIPPGFRPMLSRQFERPPHVPTGLADIVARCLAFEPEERYPSAALLAEDLRRQFADLPLRGVPNRSLPERWGKWRRRRPHALGRALVAGCVVLGTVGGALTANGDARQRIRSAESLLAESRGLVARHDYRAATRALERARALVTPEHGLSVTGYTPRAHRLRAVLDQSLLTARRALMAEELHAELDQLRFLHGSDVPPSAELRTLERRLQSAWAARDAMVESVKQGTDLERDARLRADALDLAVLWSDLRVRLAPPADRAARRLDALQTLDQAEHLFGPSAVIERNRQRYAEALGMTDLAREADQRARRLTPRSAWEYYALGRSFLDAGDLEAAAEALAHATDLEPKDLWGHFYQGVCAYRGRRFESAYHAFDICVALADRSPQCYYNRARAASALGDTTRALHDYERALHLDPKMAYAALNRGVIEFGAKRYDDAVRDFRRALDAGAEPVATRFNLALAYLAQGNRDAALENVDRVLKLDPQHGEARALARRLERVR